MYHGDINRHILLVFDASFFPHYKHVKYVVCSCKYILFLFSSCEFFFYCFYILYGSTSIEINFIGIKIKQHRSTSKVSTSIEINNKDQLQ
jgi:hypothetical protein